jgi:hypothetical protein
MESIFCANLIGRCQGTPISFGPLQLIAYKEPEMRAAIMSESQQSRSTVQHLPAQQARTLQIGSRQRELTVREGLLWVTVSAQKAGEQPRDVWLRPGQSLSLAAGQSVVVEGWGEASFELVPPLAARQAGSLPRRVLTLAVQLSASLRQSGQKLALTSSLRSCL